MITTADQASDDQFRVRQAGAPYVPRRNSHDARVHWVYEPKLRVDRTEFWCDDRRGINRGPGHGSLSTDFDDAVPCPVCSTLAPLPGGERS